MPEITDQKISRHAGTKALSAQPSALTDLIVANEGVDKLISEGGEGFYNYVNSLGVSKEKGFIVLSSRHHYYYDSDEMDRSKTVVYLKELNRIKEIKSLLHSHLHFLPESCNFIGCFVNNEKIGRFGLRKSNTPREKIRNTVNEELGIISRFPFMNMIYSLLDSKTDTYMSKESVSLMLAVHGFKVLNMTEVNGITFFHSRKVRQTLN
jgi:hypothetical protein